MRIKICGITNKKDALYCEKLGAHALGFIFYPQSKRYIQPEQVLEISQQLGPFIKTVGVFVNETAETINTTAAKCRLDMVQLHGDEPPEMVDQIEVPVIKGFRITDDFDYHVLNQYKNCFLLLDAYSDQEYGGTGLTFNWQNIPQEMRSRIILAGGVSEENIEKIYQDIHPAAVDLSSSVESSPGIKDHIKLDEFFDKVNELKMIE